MRLTLLQLNSRFSIVSSCVRMGVQASVELSRMQDSVRCIQTLLAVQKSACRKRGLGEDRLRFHHRVARRPCGWLVDSHGSCSTNYSTVNWSNALLSSDRRKICGDGEIGVGRVTRFINEFEILWKIGKISLIWGGDRHGLFSRMSHLSKVAASDAWRPAKNRSPCVSLR